MSGSPATPFRHPPDADSFEAASAKLEAVLPEFRATNRALDAEFQRMMHVLQSPFKVNSKPQRCGDQRETLMRCYAANFDPSSGAASSNAAMFRCEGDLRAFEQCAAALLPEFRDLVVAFQLRRAEDRRRYEAEQQQETRGPVLPPS